MNGSLQLREYPGDMVRLSCEKCGGREEIAKCERHGKMYDACMVRYVDLIPKH